jgi:PIN domain nuclease of toxin-antitoxin system
MLVAKGRLTLTMDAGAWIKRSEFLPQLTFHPVDKAIAVRSVNLPGPFHSDPADRIIVATALSLGAKVVTRDRKIQEYPHIEAVW